MYEYTVTWMNLANELGCHQLLAPLLIAAPGVGIRNGGNREGDGDVAAGDAAWLGRAGLGGIDGAHSMLESATACSSSVNVWPIISSIDRASAASFSSTLDIAKPTWIRT